MKKVNGQSTLFHEPAFLQTSDWSFYQDRASASEALASSSVAYTLFSYKISTFHAFSYMTHRIGACLFKKGA